MRLMNIQAVRRKIKRKDMINLKRNPNAGKFNIPTGYKDLGWQLTEKNAEFNECLKKGHNDRRKEMHWGEFDNSTYLCRGTDVITICDECKLIWHTDMSD